MKSMPFRWAKIQVECKGGRYFGELLLYGEVVYKAPEQGTRAKARDCVEEKMICVLGVFADRMHLLSNDGNGPRSRATSERPTSDDAPSTRSGR